MIDQVPSLPALSFTCGSAELIRLTTVLQSGFIAVGHEGDSILSFLLTLDGFTEQYLAEDVQTIFYNGDALDDFDQALSGPKATLALGAAMAGLAGAIMKKGSICGAFRKSRTVQNVKERGKQVEVLVKLFNTVARKRGPQLFASGVRLNTRDLVHFLELRPSLLEAFADITLDDAKIAASELVDALAKTIQLCLAVREQ